VLLADADEKVKYSSTLNIAAPDARKIRGVNMGEFRDG
jgi:hypothetical protein